MESETKTSLGYVVDFETWYHEPSIHKDNLAAEVWFGRYVEGGGCKWEAALRWYQFDRSLALKVEVFEDASVAFVEVPHFFAGISALGRNPTVEKVVALLQSCGFADRTERQDPAGRPPMRMITRAAVDLYDALVGLAESAPLVPHNPEMVAARTALAKARGQ